MPTGNPPWNFGGIRRLPRVTGPWNVNVTQAGRYRLTLRQWPAEANKSSSIREMTLFGSRLSPLACCATSLRKRFLFLRLSLTLDESFSFIITAMPLRSKFCLLTGGVTFGVLFR